MAIWTLEPKPPRATGLELSRRAHGSDVLTTMKVHFRIVTTRGRACTLIRTTGYVCRG